MKILNTQLDILKKSSNKENHTHIKNEQNHIEPHDVHDHSHNHHDHSHNHHDHEVHDHKQLIVDEILNTIEPKDKEVTAILFPNLEGNAHVGVLNNANNQPGMMAVDPAPEIALLKSKISPFVSIVVGIAYLITIIAMFSVFIGLLNSLSARKYEIAQ